MWVCLEPCPVSKRTRFGLNSSRTRKFVKVFTQLIIDSSVLVGRIVGIRDEVPQGWPECLLLLAQGREESLALL